MLPVLFVSVCASASICVSGHASVCVRSKAAFVTCEHLLLDAGSNVCFPFIIVFVASFRYYRFYYFCFSYFI